MDLSTATILEMQTKSCPLKSVMDQNWVYYTGGTHGPIEERAKGHKSALAGGVKMYYAKTERVSYQENKLRDKFCPGANNSNCDDAPGYVYVLCSKNAVKFQ